MMTFKRLTYQKLNDLAPYFKGLDYVYADYSLGYIFMYDEYIVYEYLESEDVLYFRYEREKELVYLAPICKKREDFPVAIKNIVEWTRSCKKRVVLRSVPDDYVGLCADIFEFEIERNAKWADYVYDAEAFYALKGKKYHAKRNYISRFKRLYGECEFEPISEQNLVYVKQFFDRFKLGEDKNSRIFAMELKATELMLDNIDLFPVESRVIKIEGKVIGFTIGEVVGNTLIVHIEKCDKNYEGVYETLTNSFAGYVLSKYSCVRYINREDDAGDEGLRRSKLSYHPIMHAVKNDLVFRDHL